MTGVKNSVASALAAGCSKLILAPFDTIKTLQQHSRTTTLAAAGGSSSSSMTLLAAAKKIASRPKGFLEFYVRTKLFSFYTGCLPKKISGALIVIEESMYESFLMYHTHYSSSYLIAFFSYARPGWV